MAVCFINLVASDSKKENIGRCLKLLGASLWFVTIKTSAFPISCDPLNIDTKIITQD